MRSIVGSAALVVTALAAVTAPVYAQGPGAGSEGLAAPREGARAMLYWRWSPDSRAPAQAGLRVDAPLHVGGFTRSVPVLDLGVTRARTTLRTFGAVAFDSSDSGDGPFESMNGDVVKKPVFWLGVGVVAIGVSCATGNWPCRDSNSGGGDTYTPPGARRR